MKTEVDVKTFSRPAAFVKAADYLELTKPRIAVMVLVTTLAGFYMASIGPMDIALGIHTLIGTALVAAGASAFNQVMERRRDALMDRTRNRPLPAGRISVTEGLIFAVATSIIGSSYLLVFANGLAAGVAMATLLLYVLAYTPLKPVTTLNTIVGAVAGALPPLIGWASASGSLPPAAWSLFLILFFWQIPHFMAIAWMYRVDYSRGGFKMLPVVDSEGHRTAQQIIAQTLALIAASLLPMMYGLTGIIYLVCALAAGIAFFVFGAVAAQRKTHFTARMLLLSSVIYLPLVFLFMMLDKTAG